MKKQYTPEEASRIIATVKTIYVDHPATLAIRHHLRMELMTATHLAGHSVGAGSITLIEAEPRWGKSRLVEEFIASAPLEDGDTILSVMLPALCSPKTMTVEFLDALVDPMARRLDSTGGQNTSRIIPTMRRKNVRMLVVDEFQHSFGPHRTVLVQETKDWLKVLLETIRIPAVLIGPPGLSGTLMQDRQIADRLACRLAPAPFDWQLDRDAFRQFLDRYERELPVYGGGSDLAKLSLAQKLHRATDGKVGLLTPLVTRALGIALLRADGPEHIIEADFHDALAYRNLTELNPFTRSQTTMSSAA